MTRDQLERGNLRVPRDDKAAAIGLALLAWSEYGVVGFPLTDEEKALTSKPLGTD